MCFSRRLHCDLSLQYTLLSLRSTFRTLYRPAVLSFWCSPPSQLTTSILRRPGTTCPLWPYLKQVYSGFSLESWSSFLRLFLRPLLTWTTGLCARVFEFESMNGLLRGRSLSESSRLVVESMAALRWSRMRAWDRRR